jgi:hypothetical protein
MSLRHAAIASSLFAFAACGAGDEVNHPTTTLWIEPAAGAQNVSSSSPFEKFFPLVDGNVYAYQTLNEMNATGALMARVHRTDATHGELQYPNGSKRFSIVPDGITVELPSGTRYVLRAPLQEGTSWQGEHDGRSRILKVNAEIETLAGKFSGCVQTLEERLGDTPVRYATTFCPGVGVVLVEAATGVNLERAELKSYGEPQAVGPDGVTKMKVMPAGQ